MRKKLCKEGSDSRSCICHHDSAFKLPVSQMAKEELGKWNVLGSSIVILTATLKAFSCPWRALTMRHSPCITSRRHGKSADRRLCGSIKKKCSIQIPNSCTGQSLMVVEVSPGLVHQSCTLFPEDTDKSCCTGKLTIFTGTAAVFHDEDEAGPGSYHCDALR